MDGIVRIDFENIEVATDFQAEYEGSIPFTRSTYFHSPGLLRSAVMRVGQRLFF